MLHLRSALLALAASTMLAGVALAQDDGLPNLSASGDHLVLDALGQKLSLPMPDWLATGSLDLAALRASPQVVYMAGDNQADLMLYPQGESEAIWSTRIGARIVKVDAARLTAFRQTLLVRYAQLCQPKATSFFQLSPDEGENLAPLGFACASYIDQLTGYQGKGEVMVMGFTRTDHGVAVVYQEWLGDAFDLGQPATWPVDVKTVEARIGQFGSPDALALAD